MRKSLSYFSLVTNVAILVSLYLSATYMSFEFLYLSTAGKLSIGAIYLPIIITIIFLAISFTLRHTYPKKFLNTRVNKLLSIFLALALSINTLRVISTSFRFNYDQLISTFVTETGTGILREAAFYGMGLFFLVVLPVILLQGWLEGWRGQKAVNTLLIALLLACVMYISDGLKSGGMWGDLFLRGIRPITILIIGSLSFGWARELFYGSLEKEI
jgi:hypothetical protein